MNRESEQVEAASGSRERYTQMLDDFTTRQYVESCSP